MQPWKINFASLSFSPSLEHLPGLGSNTDLLFSCCHLIPIDAKDLLCLSWGWEGWEENELSRNS